MTASAQSNVRYVGGALFIHVLVASLFVFASLYSPHLLVPQLGIKAALVSSDNLYPPKSKPQAAPDQDKLEQQKQAQQKQEQQQQQKQEQQQQQEELAQQKQKQEDQQLRAQQQEKQKQVEEQRVAEAQQQVKQQKQEAEKKRVEAIKQKQHEIEQQRQAAADAKTQAKREAELKAQLADEEGRDEAISAGLLNQYGALIKQRVESNWIKPPSAQTGVKCEVQVTQAMGGMVLSVTFGKCNSDAAVRQSIENAVMRSSPLPSPSDPRLFERHLSFIFNPAE